MVFVTGMNTIDGLAFLFSIFILILYIFIILIFKLIGLICARNFRFNKIILIVLIKIIKKGEASPPLQSLRLFRSPLCGGSPRNAPKEINEKR